MRAGGLVWSNSRMLASPNDTLFDEIGCASPEGLGRMRAAGRAMCDCFSSDGSGSADIGMDRRSLFGGIFGLMNRGTDVWWDSDGVILA